MLTLPRFIFGIAFATALLMTGTPVAVLIGGIVGESLATNPSFATLPLAAMVCGLALFVMPAAKILNRFGYKILFISGAVMALIANAFAITALTSASFLLWLASMVCTGMSAACAQQLRFCASHYVKTEQVSLALSVFMLAGAVAAILGPEIATRAQFSDLPAFADAYILLAILQISAVIAVCFFKPPAPASVSGEHKGTTKKDEGLLAICASVTAYGIMAFVMTATPISMHSFHGHSLESTKTVIQWHILAMFLPSLLTGKLIQKLGTTVSLLCGVACFAMAFVFTLQGVGFMHFSLGLILLGIGWNILFTTGSTLAAQHSSANFRGKHDSWVFGIQAIASLSAGVALFQLGWPLIQWLSLLAMLPLLFLIIRSQNQYKKHMPDSKFDGDRAA